MHNKCSFAVTILDTLNISFFFVELENVLKAQKDTLFVCLSVCLFVCLFVCLKVPIKSEC